MRQDKVQALLHARELFGLNHKSQKSLFGPVYSAKTMTFPIITVQDMFISI